LYRPGADDAESRRGLTLFGRGLEEVLMAIEWRKDADAALAEAKQQRKPVLADFSAAPM
jgi:hypothetical protein